MTYRILVTGSRDWDDKLLIVHALTEAWDQLGQRNDIVLVHGDCPTGADRMAKEIWTDFLGYEDEPHPADWKKYGKAAGPKRNQEMVDLGADIVLAFRNPGSRGTQDCIDRAEKAGLRVKIYEGESK